MLETVSRIGGGDLQRGAMLDYQIANQAAQIGFNEIFHLLGIILPDRHRLRVAGETAVRGQGGAARRQSGH